MNAAGARCNRFGRVKARRVTCRAALRARERARLVRDLGYREGREVASRRRARRRRVLSAVREQPAGCQRLVNGHAACNELLERLRTAGEVEGIVVEAKPNRRLETRLQFMLEHAGEPRSRITPLFAITQFQIELGPVGSIGLTFQSPEPRGPRLLHLLAPPVALDAVGYMNAASIATNSRNEWSLTRSASVPDTIEATEPTKTI